MRNDGLIRPRRLKIVIIGAGIGGLTAALALARRGLEPDVYEQAPELGEVGAGVTLWINAFRALEPLGLVEEVVRLAGGYTGTGLRRPDGTWLMHLPKDVMVRRWGAGVATVHRAELQHLLALHLKAGVLHLGAQCTGFEHTADGVIARFADGAAVRADVLIGADGIHSVVRSGLLGAAPLRHRGYSAVRAIAPAGAVPLTPVMTATWGHARQFGLGPVSGDRMSWFVGWKHAEETPGRPVTRAYLLSLFGTWHDPIPAVIEATPESAMISNEIYDRWPARTWTRGRIALLGDAVHPMTPDLGQGACQAIVDAVTLADCLAGAAEPGAALRDYQQRRWRKAAAVTLAARGAASTNVMERRLACVMRDAVVRATPEPVALRQFDLLVGRPSGRPRGSLQSVR